MVIFPLIVFDYYQKGKNITAPIRIIKSSNTGFDMQLEERVNTLAGAFSRVWYLDKDNYNADEILYPCNKKESAFVTKTNWAFSVITAIIFSMFLFSKKTWKNENKKLLALASLATLVPFLFFNKICHILRKPNFY